MKKSRNSNIKNILITSGDPDGIGPEVVSKALRPSKITRFFLFRNSKFGKKNLRNLDVYFKRITFSDFKTAYEYSLNIPFSSNNLFDINTKHSPPQWVEQAAEFCKLNLNSALVTAPLSKELIKKSGYDDIGHTDILARIDKNKNLFMLFLGKKFNTLTLTGHISIDKVFSSLTTAKFSAALEEILNFRQLLPNFKSRLPIAVLGANPHAGESGIISDFESKKLIPLINLFLKKHPKSIVGPLVPDVAFISANQKKYSIFVTCYHDQALIPFKLVHGFNGVHLTLGLSFIRTSVDHGTAKDIYNRGLADPTSMQSAIKLAVSLLKKGYTPSNL